MSDQVNNGWHVDWIPRDTWWMRGWTAREVCRCTRMPIWSEHERWTAAKRKTWLHAVIIGVLATFATPSSPDEAFRESHTPQGWRDSATASPRVPKQSSPEEADSGPRGTCGELTLGWSDGPHYQSLIPRLGFLFGRLAAYLSIYSKLTRGTETTPFACAHRQTP